MDSEQPEQPEQQLQPEQFNPPEFYEKLAQVYPEEIINNMTANWKVLDKFVCNHLDNINGSLMDFGCGKGRYSLYYQNGKVWGVDIAPTNIKIAKIRAKLVEHKFKRTFEVADVTKSLKYCGFENLISIEVIEHLPEFGNYFNNIYKILGEGGVVLITTPRPPKVNNPWIVSPEIEEFGMKGLYYHYGYTPEFLCENLTKVGLIIIESGMLPNNHSFVKAKKETR